MKHNFKSIDGAVRKIRTLEKAIVQYQRICDRLEFEKRQLAKLAATGPVFFNPLDAIAAEKLRDETLARIGLNPDGTERIRKAVQG